MKIIRINELSKVLGVSIQTIYRMEQRGELPPRVKISKRSVGWKLEDIEEYYDNLPELEPAVGEG